MSEAAVLSAPAGGKREQTKLANRQMILDAARAVFGELGYETATVRDIIRRTGLSVGAFYNYYRSKEEVYEALSDDGARRFRPILQAQYDAADGDFEAYIRGAIRAYYLFLVDEHEAWQTVRPRDERQPHMQVDSPEMQAVFEQVRSSIETIRRRDDSSKVDAEYLAAACIAIAREIGHYMLMRRPLDIDAAAEFAVQLIIGGLPALPKAK